MSYSRDNSLRTRILIKFLKYLWGIFNDLWLHVNVWERLSDPSFIFNKKKHLESGIISDHIPEHWDFEGFSDIQIVFDRRRDVIRSESPHNCEIKSNHAIILRPYNSVQNINEQNWMWKNFQSIKLKIYLDNYIKMPR